VAVEVADDGAGMSAEDLLRAFEPFYQAPQTAQRAAGGLGLGLAIVRSLVGLHGGHVSAASDGPGQGSRFTLWLPTVDAPAEPSDGGPAAAAAGDAAGTRVLVVDDNTDAADTAAALLETCGFEVRVAYEPDQALKLLAGWPARVALLDIGLPGMDGYQLARTIRARTGGASIGLVALTGYGQANDVQRALDSGFDAHMTKPVDVQALLALIGKLAAG
jgi:CheY-like chemotaxis protein